MKNNIKSLPIFSLFIIASEKQQHNYHEHSIIAGIDREVVKPPLKNNHTYQPIQWRNQDLEPDFKGGSVFSQEVLITLILLIASYM